LRRYVPVRDGSLCGAAASSQLIQITTVHRSDPPVGSADALGDGLLGWAYRTRTAESVREPPNWICVTISPEVGASPAAETLRVRAAWRLRAGIHNRVRAMGIRDRPISPRSPWQNPVAERLIGTRTAFARGSDSAAAPVRPSSTEASVAYRKNEISNSTGS